MSEPRQVGAFRVRVPVSDEDEWRVHVSGVPLVRAGVLVSVTTNCGTGRERRPRRNTSNLLINKVILCIFVHKIVYIRYLIRTNMNRLSLPACRTLWPRHKDLSTWG